MEYPITRVSGGNHVSSSTIIGVGQYGVNTYAPSYWSAGLGTCHVELWHGADQKLRYYCGITTVAVFISGLLDRKEDALRQQLREWCYDAPHKKGYGGKGCNRASLDVTRCFVPLVRWILQWWACDEKRLALALDATMLGERLAVLTISVVYRGCAIPVAWRVVRANTKGAWRPHLIQLVHSLNGSVPSDWTVIVLADRGLYAKWLYRQIVKIGWHPFLRINRGAKYRLPDESSWRYAVGVT
jgi:hypothetical protein